MTLNPLNIINNLPAVVKNIPVKICLLTLYLLKLEFVGVGVDFYRIAFGEFAGQKLGGKLVLQPLLNRPLQRPRTKDRVVPLIHDLLPRIISDFKLYLLTIETLSQVI